MAQKSAEAKTEAAKQEADAIISEARAKSERIVFEAMERAGSSSAEVVSFADLKRVFKGDMAALLSKFSSILNSIEDKPEES